MTVGQHQAGLPLVPRAWGGGACQPQSAGRGGGVKIDAAPASALPPPATSPLAGAPSSVLSRAPAATRAGGAGFDVGCAWGGVPPLTDCGAVPPGPPRPPRPAAARPRGPGPTASPPCPPRPVAHLPRWPRPAAAPPRPPCPASAAPRLPRPAVVLMPLPRPAATPPRPRRAVDEAPRLLEAVAPAKTSVTAVRGRFLAGPASKSMSSSSARSSALSPLNDSDPSASATAAPRARALAVAPN